MNNHTREGGGDKSRSLKISVWKNLPFKKLGNGIILRTSNICQSTVKNHLKHLLPEQFCSLFWTEICTACEKLSLGQASGKFDIFVLEHQHKQCLGRCDIVSWSQTRRWSLGLGCTLPWELVYIQVLVVELPSELEESRTEGTNLKRWQQELLIRDTS